MKFNNRNVFISPTAQIGANVKIGDNTVIYDNVEIGDNTIVANDCILGEPTGDYYKDPDNYTNAPLIIGADSLIRSHCILYAGSTFGEGLITGHHVVVREKAQVGTNCLLSTFVDVQGNCSIGNHTRLYSNVHVGELTLLGNFVYVFPFTVFTNDPQPPSLGLKGSTVGDYTFITVHCSILPGVSIGKHALIGANSVVSRDVADYMLALGSPAKAIADVRTIPSKDDKTRMHYPWTNHFYRGMPWEEGGYEDWIKKEENAHFRQSS